VFSLNMWKIIGCRT